MADGWRSRLMAPVYAFGVAFLVALAMGYFLKPAALVPDPVAGPATSAANVQRIQVAVHAGQPQATALIQAGVEFIAEHTDGSTIDGKLDPSGNVALTGRPLNHVCVVLPEQDGWAALPPSKRFGDQICRQGGDGAVTTISVAFSHG